MHIEVLVSCMNQGDMSIVKKNNIQTDALIINQCNENSYVENEMNKRTVRMYSSTQRGLSYSRNLALNNAKGDICIICDDDVTYVDGYEKIIVEAFSKLRQADIIIFNTEKINYSQKKLMIEKICKAPKYKGYGSVRIAFKRKSVQRANVWFNVNFGAGSVYESGEESLWLKEVRKKGLNVYLYPAIIASVDYSGSTWFRGYDEKFFYDKGAFLAATYPFLKILYKYYYPIKLMNKTNLPVLDIIKWLNRGIGGYKNLWSFSEFIDNKGSNFKY